MFYDALHILLDFAPFILVFSLIIGIWSEIDEYFKIKKFKFPTEQKAFGHAFTILATATYSFFSFSGLVFSLILSWKVANLFDNGFLFFFSGLGIIFVGMLIALLPLEIIRESLIDRSDVSQLLNQANKQLSNTSSQLTNNEKAAIIKKHTDIYWNNFRKNFWKLRLTKK